MCVRARVVRGRGGSIFSFFSSCSSLPLRTPPASKSNRELRSLAVNVRDLSAKREGGCEGVDDVPRIPVATVAADIVTTVLV